MAHSEPAGEEEEEHHGSPWPVIIAIGMGVGYVGIVSASVPMLLVGLVIFAGGAGGLIHHDMQKAPSGFSGLASAAHIQVPHASGGDVGILLVPANPNSVLSAA